MIYIPHLDQDVGQTRYLVHSHHTFTPAQLGYVHHSVTDLYPNSDSGNDEAPRYRNSET